MREIKWKMISYR